MKFVQSCTSTHSESESEAILLNQKQQSGKNNEMIP